MTRPKTLLHLILSSRISNQPANNSIHAFSLHTTTWTSSSSFVPLFYYFSWTNSHSPNFLYAKHPNIDSLCKQVLFVRNFYHVSHAECSLLFFVYIFFVDATPPSLHNENPFFFFQVFLYGKYVCVVIYFFSAYSYDHHDKDNNDVVLITIPLKV